jgi:hypothetical protein
MGTSARIDKSCSESVMLGESYEAFVTLKAINPYERYLEEGHSQMNLSIRIFALMCVLWLGIYDC